MKAITIYLPEVEAVMGNGADRVYAIAIIPSLNAYSVPVFMDTINSRPLILSAPYTPGSAPADRSE